jgi:hypothetical protein
MSFSHCLGDWRPINRQQSTKEMLTPLQINLDRLKAAELLWQSEKSAPRYVSSLLVGPEPAVCRV